mgnify:CR=1 FL=1
MKKSILKLGNVLGRTEQKLIKGGLRSVGISDGECNQNTQSQRFCTATNDACELDAYCNYSTNRCVCAN